MIISQRTIHLSKYIFFALILLFISSCASSRRMERISPFDDGHDILAPNPNRTNLWPIYYKNGPLNSAIWPLADWDDKGIAIRPLYVRDEADHAILFPLWGWNTEDQDGWFTTIYWDSKKNSYGFFPLFRQYDRGFSHYGPYWKDKKSWGLFPFISKNNRKKSWQFLNSFGDEKSFGFLPIIYYKKNKQFWFAEIFSRESRREHTRYRFLSFLARMEFNKQGLSRHYLMPLWSYKKTANFSQFLSPIAYTYKDNKSSDAHIFPLWYSHKNKQNQWQTFIPFWHYQKRANESKLISPLAYYRNNEDQQKFHIFPLWYSGRDNKNSWNAFLPFFYNEKENDSHLHINPLFGYGSSKDEQYSFTNIIGPLYINHRRGDSSFRSFLWPIYSESKKGKTKTYKCLEFLAQLEKKNGKTNAHHLWPLWDYKKHKDGYRFISPLVYNRKTKTTKLHINPLFGFGDSTDNSFKFRHILGPLYFEYQDIKKTKTAILWPFYQKVKKQNSTETTIFPIHFKSQMADKSEYYNFLGLHHYAHKNSNNESAWRLWPFVSYSENSTLNDSFYGSDALNILNITTTKERAESNMLFDILYSYKRIGDKTNPKFKSFSSLLFSSEIDLRPTKRYRIKMSYGGRDQVLEKKETRWLLFKRTATKCRPWPKIQENDFDLKGLNWHQRQSLINTESQTLAKDIPTYQKMYYSIPFLYKAEFTEKESHWSFLFGLGRYKRQGDRSHLSFMRFLYKMTREGENCTRDIFPFIKLDTGKTNGFSFLGFEKIGYFFSWKKGPKKGHHGHFLFFEWD